MALKLNFTNFTAIETGASSTITTTSTTLTCAKGDAGAYVSAYYRPPPNVLAGNFSFDFQGHVNSADPYANCWMFGASQALGSDQWQLGNSGHCIFGGFRVNSDGSKWFRLISRIAGVLDINVQIAYAWVAGTDYYFHITKTGTALSMTVYTDAAHTNLIATCSGTLGENVAYTYLYAASDQGNALLNFTVTGMTDNVWDPTKVLNSSIASTDTNLQTTPRHRHLWYDGGNFQHLRIDGTTGPRINYLPSNLDTSVVGSYARQADSAVPTVPATITAPRKLDSYFNYTPSYAVLLTMAAQGYANNPTDIAKNDNASPVWFDSTGNFGRANLSITDEVSVLIDELQYVWVAGRYGSPGALKVYRGGPYNEVALAEILSIDLTGVTNVAPMLVGYANNDSGLLYAKDTSLYYRHFNGTTATWGAEEAVVTGLDAYDSFRGVVARNGTLYVQYKKSAPAGTLAFKARPLGGAFGGEVSITTDVGTGYRHTSMADAGQTDRWYAIYHNGTDLLYRTVTAGVVAAPTTLQAGVVLKSTGLAAPAFDSQKLCVAYHDNASGYILLASADLTPPAVYAGTGTLLTSKSNPSNCGYPQRVTDGTVSLVMEQDRGGFFRARLFNETSQTWMGDWATVTKRFWDNHNQAKIYADPNTGIVYLFYGGRLYTDTNWMTYVTVKKTAARLNTYATAAALYAALVDISPPTGSYGTTRGYKQVMADRGGTLYYMWEAISQIWIGEYRSGVWSTPVKLADITGWTADTHTYMQGLSLGPEPVGTQQSLSVFWDYRGEEPPQLANGSYLHRELHYMKIVPNGDGTYAVYRADGTALSLPIAPNTSDLVYTSYQSFAVWQAAHAYTVNTIITGGNGHVYRVKSITTGTSGGSAPTWPTNHWATVVDGGVTWEEYGVQGTDYISSGSSGQAGAISPVDGRPCVVMNTRYTVAPYQAHRLMFYHWDGTNWATSVVDAGGANMPSLGYPTATIVASGKLYVLFAQVVSGVAELYLYSSDTGSSWAKTAVTSGSAENVWWYTVTPRDASTAWVTWSAIPHRAYAEGVMEVVTFVASLSLTSVSPTRGRSAGGTHVTITGVGLTGTTTATFDGVSATGYVVVNDTTAECDTPPHAAGLVDLVVN